MLTDQDLQLVSAGAASAALSYCRDVVGMGPNASEAPEAYAYLVLRVAALLEAAVKHMLAPYPELFQHTRAFMDQFSDHLNKHGQFFLDDLVRGGIVTDHGRYSILKGGKDA